MEFTLTSSRIFVNLNTFIQKRYFGKIIKYCEARRRMVGLRNKIRSGKRIDFDLHGYF